MMKAAAPAIPLPPLTKVKPLGKGSFGKVYLCRDNNNLKEQSVLKEVPLAGLSAKEQKRSMSEAAVLQRLKHPHLISYRGSEVTRAPHSTLRICMEFADGGDLGGRIEQLKKGGKYFSEEEILKVVAQSVSAMAHCHHSLYLLHRDIKPANIFLTKAGDVKIGDFGLSKSLAASHGMAATKCGSPLYMSPELCSGRPYDRGCDVWALGCVMYEMMTLEPPWLDQVGPRGGMMQLMRLIAGNGKVTLSKSARGRYSHGLCTLLASLLTKPATARPNFRQLLSHPLLLPHLPPPSPVATPPASSRANAFEAIGPIARCLGAAANASTTSALDSPEKPKDAAGAGRGGAAGAAGVAGAAAGAAAAAGAPAAAAADRDKAKKPPPLSAAEWAELHLKAPPAKEDRAAAHGMEDHAAAAVIQRSFHQRRAGSPRG